MTRMSEGIYRYKVLVVGKNGKLNELIEVSVLWSNPIFLTQWPFHEAFQNEYHTIHI